MANNAQRKRKRASNIEGNHGVDAKVMGAEERMHRKVEEIPGQGIVKQDVRNVFFI